MVSIEKIKRLADTVAKNTVPGSNTNTLIGNLLKAITEYMAEQHHGAVGGYQYLNSIDQLPTGNFTDKQRRTGYVIGDCIFFYVGTGGDTLDGEYQNGGSFHGTKGDDGLSAYEVWKSIDGNEGKNVEEFLASLRESGYKTKYVNALPGGSATETQTENAISNSTYANIMTVDIAANQSFTVNLKASATGIFKDEKVTIQLYKDGLRLTGSDVTLEYTKIYTRSEGVDEIRVSRANTGVLSDGSLTISVTTENGGNIEDDTIYAYPDGANQWSESIYVNGEWKLLATHAGSLSNVISGISNLDERINALDGKYDSFEKLLCSSVKENTWIEGYYVKQNGTTNGNPGWKYMSIDISGRDSISITAQFNGGDAYCHLKDFNGNILHSWNNQTFNGYSIDLSEYPTANTLMICERLSANGFVMLYSYGFARKNTTVSLNERLSLMETKIKFVYPLLIFNGHYMHFSIDDSHSAWEYLVDHPNMESIFDGGKLRDYKSLHDQTGIKITLNLFCCNASVANAGSETYNLSDIPDTWAEEFQENKDWLKFSLHSYYTDQQYGTPIAGHSLLQDYTYFKAQVIRFTGSADCIDTQVRLGYYNCPSVTEALSIHGIENGVTLYSTADDNRESNMYLSSSAKALINEKGMLYDTDNELMFIRSMYRLDEADGRSGLITMMKQHKACSKIVETYCHEAKFSGSALKNLFNELREMGYSFAFLSEIIGA